jgi:hypothetical protein
MRCVSKIHYKGGIKMNKFDTTIWREEIKSEVELLKDMEAGTDEYKVTVDGLTKLTDRVIELEKLNLQIVSAAQTELNKLNEEKLKQEQLNAEKKDRIVSHILRGVEIIVPIGVTVWGTYKTMKFEKEGTITTIFGREFFRKLFCKK